MKGSCKSLIELEYLFEEVYKASTDQLDWINPKGQQYPHDLRKPLPLIPNTRGRHVIPFDHFINNDLEYLSGFAANNESARDVYFKRRIIAVTKIEIVEWHNYKHIDWITVRKLTNLIVEERLAFNVSLRMFTRSIVIQRRVEDLQFGVKSYQKKLNLTKPDTYKPDHKRREAYTAYSNLRGLIYQNKEKNNRLMCIDELHKFIDGAMIQEIDKQLKTRRIIRSLEKFVGGRSYEGRSSRIRRILKDGVKEFQRSFCHSDTERLSRSDEVLKLKNFKKDATLKFFKSTNQERYEHVGPEVTSSQDGQGHKMAKKRLCLVDDLKVFKITFKTS
ncbi:hypothetical protein Tco_1419662 [Tanacetum coccineum]